MALLFMDGFDKYGPVNSNTTATAALLLQEWTTASGASIVAPLSATGQAVNWVLTGSVVKTLAASYSRLIGGMRFSSSLVTSTAGVLFTDAGSSQASISINTAGTISVRNGSITGTVLGTSTASVAASSTHYLEWDITFSNTGSYQIWLDGVSILSGSGDTTGTVNNTANGVGLNNGGANVFTVDDLYLFDTTGTTNNAVLLTSPRIETSLPSSDGAVQFAVGAATLGSIYGRTAPGGVLGDNTMVARPLTPTRNCTLSAIIVIPAATGASINLRPVVYTDSAGLPNTLISSGSTAVGMTAGTVIRLPLTTSQALTAGTQYWLGYMWDALPANGIGCFDRVSDSFTRKVGATFTSGAPATFPGGSTTDFVNVAGVITLASPVNFYSLTSPPQGNYSYVYDSVVGQEDLYAVPNLSAPATSIYAVAVKANVAKSDAGAKTVSVRLKSGAADSAGSGGSLAPGTSYAWLTSLYPTDPATSAAWTLTAVNAAQIGLRIES
jgi:hypothetical protein